MRAQSWTRSRSCASRMKLLPGCSSLEGSNGREVCASTQHSVMPGSALQRALQARTSQFTYAENPSSV